MQYTITHDPEDRGLIIALTGVVTGRFLLDVNKAAWAAHAGRDLEWELWDFRKADRIDASAEDMRTIAILNHHESTGRGSLKVAVVGSREVLAGTDQIYNIFASVWTGVESETFESVEEALNWVRNSGEAY